MAPTAAALLDQLKGGSWDLILLDVRLPDMDGIDAIPRCRDLAPETPIIVMTAHGTREIATEAITRGAYDFFTKPLKMSEFQVVVSRALERRRLQQQVKVLREAQAAGGFEELIGKSESLKRVIDMAQRAAPTDLTVLIDGESGTGKELMARAIHRLSARKDGPFIPVNCAAIPEGLLESELFGHERGAFTGAIRARPGRFELAREGTLFLDEIGDMPLAMQAKILRVLQERQFERVGGDARHRRRRPRHRRHPPGPRHPGRARAASAPISSTGCRACGSCCRRCGSASTTCPLLVTHLLERAAQRLWRAARHRVAGGAPLSLDLSVARQYPRAAARARGRHGALRRRHPPRAPAPRRPARTPRPAAAGDAGAPVVTGSLDETLEEWERRAHSRRAPRGARRPGARGQAPRHHRAQPLVSRQEAQDPGAHDRGQSRPA